jgi:hypothetical protein
VVREYDPERDAKRDAQDRADDDELEKGSDIQKSQAIFDKRYGDTDEFEQAQRGFTRVIDEDRLLKVKARADAARGSNKT